MNVITWCHKALLRAEHHRAAVIAAPFRTACRRRRATRAHVRGKYTPLVAVRMYGLYANLESSEETASQELEKEGP
jgi:hypothetical protein